ncbi:hypothetical protein DMB92_05315 [Campylobacter sp. MIT 99-7217]|uniref:hypothetical protein n=1 Tax=Campylobacter sp. MIT 99-7217 TaxID=535091 RepID=UPI00115BD419|nr:hypothetical protein [Campylobacter sp. MIT 99-7217]TQR31808.1 hypothetical protein DMB92_05315 [Campylobacter sp. MIT 99-7217]
MKYLQKQNEEKLRKKFRLKKALLSELNKQAKKRGKSKNLLLNEAINDYFSYMKANHLFANVLILEAKNDKP